MLLNIVTEEGYIANSFRGRKLMIRALSQGKEAVNSCICVLNKGRICGLLMRERGSLLQKRTGRPRSHRLPGLVLAAAVMARAWP